MVVWHLADVTLAVVIEAVKKAGSVDELTADDTQRGNGTLMRCGTRGGRRQRISCCRSRVVRHGSEVGGDVTEHLEVHATVVGIASGSGNPFAVEADARALHAETRCCPWLRGITSRSMPWF